MVLFLLAAGMHHGVFGLLLTLALRAPASWQEPRAHPGAVLLGNGRDPVGADCRLPLAAAGNGAGGQHPHVAHRHLDGGLRPLLRDRAGECRLRCRMASAARTAADDVDGGAGAAAILADWSAGEASAHRGRRTLPLWCNRTFPSSSPRSGPMTTIARRWPIWRPSARRRRDLGRRAGPDPVAGIAVAVLLQRSRVSGNSSAASPRTRTPTSWWAASARRPTAVR